MTRGISGLNPANDFVKLLPNASTTRERAISVTARLKSWIYTGIGFQVSVTGSPEEIKARLRDVVVLINGTNKPVNKQVLSPWIQSVEKGAALRFGNQLTAQGVGQWAKRHFQNLETYELSPLKPEKMQEVMTLIDQHFQLSFFRKYRGALIATAAVLSTSVVAYALHRYVIDHLGNDFWLRKFIVFFGRKQTPPNESEGNSPGSPPSSFDRSNADLALIVAAVTATAINHFVKCRPLSVGGTPPSIPAIGDGDPEGEPSSATPARQGGNPADEPSSATEDDDLVGGDPFSTPARQGGNLAGRDPPLTPDTRGSSPQQPSTDPHSCSPANPSPEVGSIVPSNRGPGLPHSSPASKLLPPPPEPVRSHGGSDALRA